MKQPVISQKLSAELEAYRGRWVAVLDDRLVAVADSVSAVQKLALERGVTDPVVFRVPTQYIGFVSFR